MIEGERKDSGEVLMMLLEKPLIKLADY